MQPEQTMICERLSWGAQWLYFCTLACWNGFYRLNAFYNVFLKHLPDFLSHGGLFALQLQSGSLAVRTRRTDDFLIQANS